VAARRSRHRGRPRPLDPASPNIVITSLKRSRRRSNRPRTDETLIQASSLIHPVVRMQQPHPTSRQSCTNSAHTNHRRGVRRRHQNTPRPQRESRLSQQQLAKSADTAYRVGNSQPGLGPADQRRVLSSARHGVRPRAITAPLGVGVQ